MTRSGTTHDSVEEVVDQYALEGMGKEEEKNIKLVDGCIYVQTLKTFSSARPLLERISLSILCIYVSLTYISYKTIPDICHLFYKSKIFGE